MINSARSNNTGSAHFLIDGVDILSIDIRNLDNLSPLTLPEAIAISDHYTIHYWRVDSYPTLRRTTDLEDMIQEVRAKLLRSDWISKYTPGGPANKRNFILRVVQTIFIDQSSRLRQNQIWKNTTSLSSSPKSEEEKEVLADTIVSNGAEVPAMYMFNKDKIVRRKVNEEEVDFVVIPPSVRVRKRNFSRAQEEGIDRKSFNRHIIQYYMGEIRSFNPGYEVPLERMGESSKVQISTNPSTYLPPPEEVSTLILEFLSFLPNRIFETEGDFSEYISSPAEPSENLVRLSSHNIFLLLSRGVDLHSMASVWGSHLTDKNLEKYKFSLSVLVEEVRSRFAEFRRGKEFPSPLPILPRKVQGYLDFSFPESRT